jgi:lipoprotein signal peptidase
MKKRSFISAVTVYRIIAASICVFGIGCFVLTAPTLNAAILALIIGGAVAVMIDESIIQKKKPK